jgi:DNA-binding beta-propeller fold protein YncE
MGQAGLILAACLSVAACAKAPPSIDPRDPASPLRLERRIGLPGVSGRIDHLALDESRQRLFVAEVANGTVDEVDLVHGVLLGRIGGLKEPQGVAYLPKRDEVAVASGDGHVRFFSAADRHLVTDIDLGDDADDVRTDPHNGHLLVGYGQGGIAEIDPAAHKLVGHLPLTGHPEGFQPGGARLFVNIPDRGIIVSADADRRRVDARWPTGLRRLNFPMALSADGKRLFIVYRFPATLVALDSTGGAELFARATCGDSDDVYAQDGRLYIVCGAGHVDVLREEDGGPIARIATAPGARTGLFSPQLGKLYVAVPAHGGSNAAIWVLDKRP